MAGTKSNGPALILFSGFPPVEKNICAISEERETNYIKISTDKMTAVSFVLTAQIIGTWDFIKSRESQ